MTNKKISVKNVVQRIEHLGNYAVRDFEILRAVALKLAKLKAYRANYVFADDNSIDIDLNIVAELKTIFLNYQGPSKATRKAIESCLESFVANGDSVEEMKTRLFKMLDSACCWSKTDNFIRFQLV